MQTYTGYGMPVTIERGSITDVRVNMESRNFNESSIEDFVNALTAQSGSLTFPAVSGQAKDVVRIIPMDSDRNEGILLIQGPAKLATNANYITLQEEAVVVTELNRNIAPYPTTFKVKQLDGTLAEVSNAGWVNMLQQQAGTNKDVVDRFAQQFGFKDSAALVDSLTYSIPDDVILFAAWLGIFRSLDDAMGLKPMIVSTNTLSSAFSSFL